MNSAVEGLLWELTAIDQRAAAWCAAQCARTVLHLVPDGEVRRKAEELAHDIARFPPVCVRTDRRSTVRSYGLPVREALIQEWYNGREALVKDGVGGATRFKDGLGRHGDFEKID